MTPRYKINYLKKCKLILFISKYGEKFGDQNIHEDEIIEVLHISKKQVLNEIKKYRNQGDDLDFSILLLDLIIQDDCP